MAESPQVRPDAHDLIDNLAGLAPADPLYAVRHRRDKVVAATQGSYDALFDSALPGLPLAERLAAAVYACRLTPAPELAAHYLQALENAGADAATLDRVQHDTPDQGASSRLDAILAFTRKLIRNPVEGDRAALLTLPAAGLDTPAVVALSQLIAFLSYQVRLLAGLKAMKAQGSAGSANQAAEAQAAARQNEGTLLPAPIKAHGFTNEVLGWKAWLDTIDLASATPEQIAVLEESHPKAKTSDYYLFLAHQPGILRQRSEAFNAIMYAPGGLARAERELGATVVSRVNGCVYCASVHAQRYEQLAKRNAVIAQVFENPATAGGTARERAIAAFSIRITETPQWIGPPDIQPLRDTGMDDGQILDLLHADAIFAWANRLMLNLGEPVFPERA